MQTQIIATIDELNQYLEGNVTDEAVIAALKELLKDRQENKEAPKEKENIQTKEEESTPSPFSKSTNPHPDPKRK